jgi:hypothetical protein
MRYQFEQQLQAQMRKMFGAITLSIKDYLGNFSTANALKAKGVKMSMLGVSSSVKMEKN